MHSSMSEDIGGAGACIHGSGYWGEDAFHGSGHCEKSTFDQSWNERTPPRLPDIPIHTT